MVAAIALLGPSLLLQPAFAQSGDDPECDCPEEECDDSCDECSCDCECSSEDCDHPDECSCEAHEESGSGCHDSSDSGEEEEEPGGCTGECHSMELPPPCPEDPEVVGEGE